MTNRSQECRNAPAPDGVTAVSARLSSPADRSRLGDGCAPADRWLFRPLDGLLPGGLPVGALTCLLLPQAGCIRRGAWSTLVGQLLLDTVDQCRPVVYTYADTAHVYGPDDGLHDLTPRYLNVLDARRTPGCRYTASVGGGGARLDPVESTLASLRRGLADHEHRHGPSLALLDHLTGARPYARAVHAVHAQAGSAINAPARRRLRSIADQCAADLLAFAASRPDAPTVVVWKATHRDPLEPDALVAAARVVLAAAHTPHREPVPVTVRTRPALLDDWPAPMRTVLPRFDWGFDTRDLDEDDLAAEDQAAWLAGGDAPSPSAPPDPWSR